MCTSHAFSQSKCAPHPFTYIVCELNFHKKKNDIFSFFFVQSFFFLLPFPTIHSMHMLCFIAYSRDEYNSMTNCLTGELTKMAKIEWKENRQTSKRTKIKVYRTVKFLTTMPGWLQWKITAIQEKNQICNENDKQTIGKSAERERVNEEIERKIIIKQGVCYDCCFRVPL